MKIEPTTNNINEFINVLYTLNPHDIFFSPNIVRLCS